MNFITQSDAGTGPIGQDTWYLGEHAGAADLCLAEEELARLDAAFPAPDHRVALDMQ